MSTAQTANTAVARSVLCARPPPTATAHPAPRAPARPRACVVWSWARRAATRSPPERTPSQLLSIYRQPSSVVVRRDLHDGAGLQAHFHRAPQSVGDQFVAHA
eukprot:5492674-Prymnesium_polylepis.2